MRTWEYAPPSERIVEDIFRWRKVLDAIVEAKGAYVNFEGSRKGRRSVTQAEAGLIQRRTRKRKTNLDEFNLHPIAKEALQKQKELFQNDGTVLPLSLESLDMALEEEEIGTADEE